MLSGLAYRLSQATPMARRLLALLVLVFLPLLAVFTVVIPLLEARQAGEVRLAEAEAVHMWVYSQAERLPPSAFSAAPAPESGPSDPIGISGLEASLVAAGLRETVSRLANSQGGSVEIAFEEVPFRAFTDWLDANAPDWGYDFTRFNIERAETPGHVGVLIELAPAS